MALSDGLNTKIDVVDGNTVRLSSSATVSGAATAVQALGLQALTIALADGIGRTLTANDGGDTITASSGNDTLLGGAGNDTLDGGSGSNVIDGAAGDNTAVFNFASTAALVSRSGAAWVLDVLGTHDVLTNIQHYRFTDTTLNHPDRLTRRPPLRPGLLPRPQRRRRRRRRQPVAPLHQLRLA